MARSTRKQPFCWQEKKILRLFRELFEKADLVKFRCLYGAITEIDSDFNGKDIQWYTKTIASYSGLSIEWIPSALKKLEELKIIKIVEERRGGQFFKKEIVFTPEDVEDPRQHTQKTVTGKTGNGETDHKKIITSLEDNLVSQSDLNSNSDPQPEKPPEEKTTDRQEEFIKKYVLQGYPRQVVLNSVGKYQEEQAKGTEIRHFEKYFERILKEQQGLYDVTRIETKKKAVDIKKRVDLKHGMVILYQNKEYDCVEGETIYLENGTAICRGEIEKHIRNGSMKIKQAS